ncbi:hypothetical protein TMatcc_006507 [Talaromyces marneffei ATCC 18224]|uniref:Uncharacterized protein n=2 Tax=Talaromyces marneffei TaxID=37727 RepID=B6QAL4_TALMQ|nr:uncharacterized protein EYB26_002557 [Talaromyces marneffei]EEA25272.1 hypothetical protein PMAA_063880 [Talaromyces marneffei ATCC 18224]KAE8554002.1 hypothetical protein EYB25_002540 [Talaromyces marneffei]QGA14901.1 hypothetical protein EYB26_002557 [Talaromyces marneffei]
MARVSRFIEDFDLTYTATSGHDSQITLADETIPLVIPTKSVAKSKTITKTFAEAFKAVRSMCTNCVTNYKHHVCNLGQNVNIAHNDSENVEAGSISSSSYGAPMTSEAELERQSKRYNLRAIYGLCPDSESSTFTAYTAKKQPTTAITKVQATAEPRTPDAPTVWAQAFDKSEIESIEKNTKATIEFLGIELEIEV